MQFALLIFESPEAFAARQGDENDPYLGAWRAYYKALVEADIYVSGNPLQSPETGTTVRLKDGKRRVQDGPFADTRSNWEASPSWSFPRWTRPWNGRRDVRRPRSALWRSVPFRLNTSVESRAERQKNEWK